MAASRCANSFTLPSSPPSRVVFRFRPLSPSRFTLPDDDGNGSPVGVQTFQLSSIFAIRKYGQSRQSVARLRISRGELSWKFDETIKVRVESVRICVCVCVYGIERSVYRLYGHEFSEREKKNGCGNPRGLNPNRELGAVGERKDCFLLKM